MVGRVKWFNDEKGYGFIEYEDLDDIFFHYSVIQMDGFKTLTSGQKVQFKLTSTEKGLQAFDVLKA